jgi:predicted MFS family arabinose efflux permease
MMSLFKRSSDSVDVESRSALAAVCYLMAVGGLEFSIMPIFLGGMATHLLFNEQQIGFIGSSYLAGFTLTSFSAVFWSRRVSWRGGVLLAALVPGASYLTAMVAREYFWILLLTFVVGCSRGVFYAISVCALSDRQEAERSFALGTVASMMLAGFGMLVLPYIMESAQIYGLFVPLIVVSILGTLVVGWLPVGGKREAETAQGADSGKRSLVFLGLGGLLIFWIGMCGIWAFLERIGNASGLSSQAIGTVLAVSYGAVILVAFLAAWLGDRLGRAAPIFIGVMAMLVGIVSMDRTLTFTTYMVASLLFQCGWIFSYPYMMAVISRSDKSGRFVPLIAAAQGLGAAVGAGLGGSLLTTAEGYSALYQLGLICLLVSAVTFGWVMFRQRADAVPEGG